ncbi:hypothetical protein [Humibacillus xanthopallidus]|uniref:Hemerythrin HHE cation binding domain-containing protein n=1 Tax=Humibacillus xanthopallidus TaxID=412689 RepID=A0A543HUR6_9MICO|nr:hypothetical protein [Humibacillus xanthopallidus]TQM62014.1 hypothetical protein FBY41_2037 [Humibacillus xanthopallidus]
MQPRAAVADVVRVVARQHTRMRGLVCEVAQTTGAERAAASRWLSHYVVLHTVAEQLGLSREPSADVQRVVPRNGLLLELALGLAAAPPLEEAAICRCAAALEEAVVQHARAQERTILPRLLASWRAADLLRAGAAFEAADLLFDRGPSEQSEPTTPSAPPTPFTPIAPVAPTEVTWRRAVADIERLLGSGDDQQSRRDPRSVQPPAARTEMTTAATVAVTPTATVTTAVRRT